MLNLGVKPFGSMFWSGFCSDSGMISLQSCLPLIFLAMGIAGFYQPLNAQKLSQQVIATTGQEAEQSGIHLSYTVGEPVATLLTGDTLLLTQGYHQQFPPGSVAIHEILPGIMLTIYPNPFSDLLFVQLQGDLPTEGLKAVLINAVGQVALSSPFPMEPKAVYQLSISQLPPGQYTFQLIDPSLHILHSSPVIKASGH